MDAIIQFIGEFVTLYPDLFIGSVLGLFTIWLTPKVVYLSKRLELQAERDDAKERPQSKTRQRKRQVTL